MKLLFDKIKRTYLFTFTFHVLFKLKCKVYIWLEGDVKIELECEDCEGHRLPYSNVLRDVLNNKGNNSLK